MKKRIPEAKTSDPPRKFRNPNFNGYRYGERGLKDKTGWGMVITSSSRKSNDESKIRNHFSNEDTQLRTAASNKLDRDANNTNDIDLHGRHDLVPDLKEGRISLIFTPEQDENGQYKNQTFEIGILKSDGTEQPLINKTTNEPGNISAKYKLGEGEKIYTKGQGDTRTTTAPIKDNGN